MFARSLAKTLVRTALSEGRKPRLHPNGFVQFDLIPGGDVHLHVWPDEPLQTAQQKTKHSIHTHCFAMESLVLCGRITNYLYSTRFVTGLTAEQIHLPVYWQHAAHSLGNSETVLKPVPNGGPVVVIEDSATVVEPGQSYTMPAAVLHDSKTHGLTATIMTKAQYLRGHRPLVAVPVGVVPDNDFRRGAADEDLLLRVINKALDAPTITQGDCNHEKDVIGCCCFNYRAAMPFAVPRFPGDWR